MRARTFILLILSGILALGCERVRVTEETPTLGVLIQMPGASTKADTGELEGSNAENALRSLRIWVFESESHDPVSSLALVSSQFPTPGQTRYYAVPVTSDFAHARPDVDVFALANAASIGCTLDGDATWDDVNDALFSNPYFGVETPVRTVDPELGLPFSGVGRGLPVTGEDPVLKIETVTLSRAVSKMCFAFCRMKNDVDADVISINRIVLNGGRIPLEEYVFLGASGTYAIVPDNYDTALMTVDGPSSLPQNEAPEKLVYSGQSPSAYQALLDKAIEDGELVSLPPVYLRETNKKLTGHVEYTINGVDGQTDFSMEDQGDFARNHTWTLYGYFLSGRNLQLTLSVQPWDLNNFTVDYNDSVVEASQLNLDTNTCEIVNVGDDKYNVYLKPGEPAKGTFYIRRPQSGKLLIQPVGDANAFEVTPDIWDIDHTNNDGRVDLIVRQNPDAQSAPAGSTITLSFTVEHAGREIDANTEILNGATYNFIL